MSNCHLNWWKERCRKETSTKYSWHHTFDPRQQQQTTWNRTGAATLPPFQGSGQQLSPRKERELQLAMQEREQSLRMKELEIAQREQTLMQQNAQMQQYMSSRWGAYQQPRQQPRQHTQHQHRHYRMPAPPLGVRGPSRGAPRFQNHTMRGSSRMGMFSKTM